MRKEENKVSQISTLTKNMSQFDLLPNWIAVKSCIGIQLLHQDIIIQNISSSITEMDPNRRILQLVSYFTYITDHKYLLS